MVEKWVYEKKMNAQGRIELYEARLIVKCYQHKAGIDYDKVFAPVTRMETIRFFIALAAQLICKFFRWM